LSLALEEETPARVREIYPRYRSAADYVGTNPLVRRRMHDHLSDLAMQGILSRNTRNEGRAGGKYYVYDLDVAVDMVLDVIEDLETVDLPPDVLRQAP